jgi:hypothetical protein
VTTTVVAPASTGSVVASTPAPPVSTAASATTAPPAGNPSQGCTLDQRAKAHAFCETKRPGSWCKFDAFPSVCQGTNYLCACSSSGDTKLVL